MMVLVRFHFGILQFLILYLTVIFSYSQESALTAASRLLLHRIQYKEINPLPEGFCFKQHEDGKIYVSGLAEFTPDFNAAIFESIGVRNGSKAGNIYTVWVPLDKVKEFISLDGLIAFEPDQPALMHLDSVRKAARIDSVHQGIGLPLPLSGKNVVMGIIDAGYDYTHPVLFDTTYVSYRVKKIWEQKIQGTPPKGFFYGRELNDTSQIFSVKTDLAEGSHGIHVAGIAAGSGVDGSPEKTVHRGVAWQSDIVLVAILPSESHWFSTGMSDFIDGIQYIFNYADSVGKPAVVNLSWGCPLGPRDGQSLFSKALNNLVGSGKIFVLSAGNNNNNLIHLEKNFLNLDTSVSTIITFPATLPQKKNWIDIWGEP
ncbi:MAG: S8 family serine peptidase, partial [Chitinophagales bacterium]|nr:S8 family serine peptidase [Chitinophagales bacterium]